jgi:2-oxoglutarate/2-oxoacid ferredoxin oxidoreductase subunit beta
MSGCHCGTHDDVKFKDFFSKNLYTWCTNCGNYGIHAAVKRALVEEDIAPCDTLLCFDVGCHGNGSDKIGGYRFHGLHGRIIPFASGAAVANRTITVVAFGGDGGTLGEGINHLVAGIRGNYDVTFILHNNLNYGLTQGQASPTTKPGVKMNTAPDGITADPLHPMRFALSLHPSFAARTFSGDIHHMTSTIRAALNHKGFSFVEVLQGCPTYNKMTPHEWYQERVKDVSQIAGYDPLSYKAAAEIAEDLETQIAIGVLYQDSNRQHFMDRQANRIGVSTELVEEVRPFSAAKLFDTFR